MNATINYILIVNPISGGTDKTNIIQSIKEFASKHSINLIVYETTDENDKANIRSLFDRHKFERAIVAGGDGTIKMVAEALDGQDIIYGILPSGSANGLAKDLELPDTLEVNLEIAFHHKAIEIDIVLINGMKCLHLSDIGLNARLIKNYEEGAIRGKLGYALHTIKTLAQNMEPFQAQIEYEGNQIETEAHVIILANSQKYGTGIVINPSGVIDDGKFEIVIFKSLDWLMVGKILLGNMPIEGTDIEIISTNKATIRTSPAVNFQIDGEYCDQITELDIDILPRHIRVAVP